MRIQHRLIPDSNNVKYADKILFAEPNIFSLGIRFYLHRLQHTNIHENQHQMWPPKNGLETNLPVYSLYYTNGCKYWVSWKHYDYIFFISINNIKLTRLANSIFTLLHNAPTYTPQVVTLPSKLRRLVNTTLSSATKHFVWPFSYFS